MTYIVKEIFYTLQGEGANAGTAAVFCRFAGCNLWSGREADRATAICKFCDTDFVGTDGTLGGKFSDATALADAIAGQWPNADHANRFAVMTGGEPLLQIDSPLIDALHVRGFRIAVETNGTLMAPAGLDWVCVSPKFGSTLIQHSGDELKVVIPQPGVDLLELERLDFAHRFVQPMDGPHLQENTALAVQWCMDHPRWRLSVQTHKVISIR